MGRQAEPTLDQGVACVLVEVDLTVDTLERLRKRKDEELEVIHLVLLLVRNSRPTGKPRAEDAGRPKAAGTIPSRTPFGSRLTSGTSAQRAFLLLGLLARGA